MKQFPPWRHNSSHSPTKASNSARRRAALPRPKAALTIGISPQIEHRLFSYISINWRAKPLVSRQAVIDLIASTTTTTGLKVYARLDPNTYATKIQVSDEQMRAVKDRA